MLEENEHHLGERLLFHFEKGQNPIRICLTKVGAVRGEEDATATEAE